MYVEGSNEVIRQKILEGLENQAQNFIFNFIETKNH